MARVLSALGVGLASTIALAAVSFVIALSVFMNGYFAFMRLGGELSTVLSASTNVAPLIAAGVVACIDILKAFAPVFAARAWRVGAYGYVLMSVALLVGGITLSGLAAYGLIMEQRSGVKSERTATKETASDLLIQRKDARARIAALGASRPVATIEAELAAKRQHRRWDSTKGCVDATAGASRRFCAEYNQLQGELGQAQALAAARAKLAGIETKLEAIRARGGVRPTDPQMESLSKVFGWRADKIEVAVLLLIAVMIEFVSAFGLYFALGHGGRTPPRAAPQAAPEKGTAKTAPAAQPIKAAKKPVVVDAVATEALTEPTALADASDPVAELGEYGVARLERVEGASVALSALYTDYCQWCSAMARTAMERSDFEQTLSRIAEHVDEIELKARGRGRVLINMQIRRRLAAA